MQQEKGALVPPVQEETFQNHSTSPPHKDSTKAPPGTRRPVVPGSTLAPGSNAATGLNPAKYQRPIKPSGGRGRTPYAGTARRGAPPREGGGGGGAALTHRSSVSRVGHHEPSKRAPSPFESASALLGERRSCKCRADAEAGEAERRAGLAVYFPETAPSRCPTPPCSVPIG